MVTIGSVSSWSDEQGWGVIESGETPGGCWAHFSVVAVAGYRSLQPGQRVNLDWEPVVDADGYSYRAVRTWPVGSDPVITPPQPAGGAYRSRCVFAERHDTEPSTA